MFNILKNSLIYTAVYFVYCTAVFLLLVTIQIFWKPVAFMFCIIVALLTLGHFYPNFKVIPEPSEAMAAFRLFREARKA